MGAFRWAVYAVMLFPIWGALAWHFYQFTVRPRLLARDEIEGLIEDMLATDDPETAAFGKEWDAWYRGKTFEQGQWRRVRRALRAMEG